MVYLNVKSKFPEKTEKELYELFGMPYMKPKFRKNHGET